MDIFVNNPPAQSTPMQAQVYPAPGYPAPAYGYTQGYAPAPYGPGFHGHPGGGFGFVLLLLLGVFLFMRFRMMQGGRRGRQWRRMMAAQGQPDEATQERGSHAAWGRFPWSRDNAIDIARERFARGEIDAEQLAAILKGLDAG